jgi:hypothetical protein
MGEIFLFAAGAFILSMALVGVLINRHHARTGFFLGLLPILAFGLWFLVPLFSCHSKDPVGCEWVGVGILIVGGLTAVMLVAYAFFAMGITHAHRSR